MADHIRPQYRHLQEKWERPLDLAVILAALATVPIIIVQQRSVDHPAVGIIDWIIWTVFLVEFIFGIRVALDRSAYARRNWLGIAVVVLSFPVLPDLLASVRIVRVARVTRLVRVLAVTGRGLRAMRSSLAGQSLIYVGALTMLLTVSAAAILAVLEPQAVGGDFWSGLWWAFVTVTTVGYGDIAPQTPSGRLLAVILMLCGLGLLSTLAASISAYFIGSDSDQDIREINQKLDRIEKLVEHMAIGDPSRNSVAGGETQRTNE